MASEQQLQKKIINYLTSKGYSVFKTVSTNRRGIADIIACSPTGRFIAIEVKAEGKMRTVSPLQQLYINEVNTIGGIAFATDNLDQVKELLS